MFSIRPIPNIHAIRHSPNSASQDQLPISTGHSIHPRHFFLPTLLLLSVVFPTNAENTNELPLNRAQSVINTFQVMCTLELPKFEQIEAKATAMRMQLQADNKGALTENVVTRSKAWGGGLTTGPFALLLDEMSGPKGKATGCAVAAEVPDSDTFRAEAINTLKLAAMRTPEIGADGSRSFVWDGIYGTGTTLILRDFKPTGRPGVMLKLLFMDRLQ